MRDLLVITPSRGRPWMLQRLLIAMKDTCALETDIAVAVDDDDPRLADYKDLGLENLRVGERGSLTTLTNQMALEYAGDYRYLASLGDDHIPRTARWDAELCGEIAAMGGTGFAYGNGSRWYIPEAIVMSSDIVSALGWMANPRCGHYRIDDTWLELGLAAGCIRYRHDVMVEHMQFGIPYDPLDPGKGMKGVKDDTYADALNPEKMAADVVAHIDWRNDADDGLLSDAAKIRALIDAKTGAAHDAHTKLQVGQRVFCSCGAMSAEQAATFSEEDEDPAEVFAAFDAGVVGSVKAPSNTGRSPATGATP